MNSEFIYDTTLRDGEQMPGVVFSREEKIDLAQKMSDFGVGIIGMMPAVSYAEREITEYLADCGLKAQITAATMMKKEHIDIAVDCGVDRVILFSPVSDIQMGEMPRAVNLKRAVEYVDYACGKGLKVDFAGVDSTRADEGYLVNFINSLNGKIDYFLACDTLGCLDPFETHDLVSMLKRESDVKIGMHCHNDYDMAVANSLAGFRAGADLISGTFTGIGERAGNAALESVVMGMEKQYEVDLSLNYKMLAEICDDVSRYSGVGLQKHKAIVGANSFTHESGIHTDAMIKNPASYENFDPAEIGREREFVAGKHSGLSILRYWFGEMFSENRYVDGLSQIKDLAQEHGVSFGKKDVLKLLHGEDLF